MHSPLPELELLLLDDEEELLEDDELEELEELDELEELELLDDEEELLVVEPPPSTENPLRLATLEPLAQKPKLTLLPGATRAL